MINEQRSANGGLMVVSSDQGMRDHITSLLQAEGFSVCTVEDAAGAVEMAAVKSPDLTLLDLGSNSGVGLDVCLSLKASKPLRNLPVVILSEETDSHFQIRALNCGAVDCLPRAATREFLVARVRALLSHFRTIQALERERRLLEGRIRDDSRKLTQTSVRLKQSDEKRVATEQQLRDAYAHIQKLVRALPSILIGLDGDGFVNHWNGVAELTFGIKEEDAIGQTLRECNIPWDGLRLARFIEACQNTGQSIRMDEISFVRQDGLMGVLGLTLNPVSSTGSEGPSLLIFGTDITDRKRLEEQLLHSQKMEAMGQLAGGVAHDFNNLLMIIMGQSDMLMGGLEAGDCLAQRVEEIKKCALRAASLTNQLLAFSRKQVIQPENLSLNEQVLDTQKMLKRLIEEDIELLVDLAPDAGLVRADPGQIVQIILNLAVNARDAMPKGGRLAIKTVNVDLDHTCAYGHEDVRPGSYVMLSVSDTGVGMNAETKARIFEPFYTTKEKGKGTGLGLSTVYGMVKQSGGFVLVYSEEGMGSTFKVYMPRVAAGGVIEAAPPVPVVPPAMSSEGTIVVVEDEPGVRELIADMLRVNGYTVHAASDGQDALERFDAICDEMDLLITDIVMPRLGGVELVKKVRERIPELKVLFMSGHADPAAFAEVKNSNPDGFLQKPFNTQRMLAKVRELLG